MSFAYFKTHMEVNSQSNNQIAGRIKWSRIGIFVLFMQYLFSILDAIV